MKDKFKKWLQEKENKGSGTAASYSGGIDRLSKHLTDIALKKYTDLYTIDDIQKLKMYSEWYGLSGKYADVGDSGHGTWRNAIKAYVRFREGKPRVRASRTYRSTTSSTQTQIPSRIISIANYNFDEDIKKEASEMNKYYELLYCLEVSLRKLVNTTMTKAYGENWWYDRMNEDIRRNVDKKIKIENRGIYSEKSVHPIYYTTFRELRMVVEQNWVLFSDILKNIADFKKITKDLNVIRNNVAHSVMLPDDEVTRLNLALKDWFRLLK